MSRRILRRLFSLLLHSSLARAGKLRENIPVRIRFLLGPAGSGKTFQCLEEVRGALRDEPDGPPLIFLAPKQATFQIERQLLSDDSLGGYTRLHILSFDRFASYVLRELGTAEPDLLAEDGRVMVLRALLTQKRSLLGLYHATARLPGFASQLSALFRELQQARLTPRHLLRVAAKTGDSSVLARKLSDLALLFQAYLDWLKAHRLQDDSSLLDLAIDALATSQRQKTAPRWGGLWLDGFAEMTAQEMDLLAAAMPATTRATLAFCLEEEPREDPSWLSTWAVVAQTFRRCHARLRALPDAETIVELLERHPTRSRFANDQTLAFIERHWTRPPRRQPELETSSTLAPASVRVLACANPEHEAMVAAREILRHVQAGGRFRETAILMRSLDGRDEAVRRVLLRYDIPFFLDRREPVAHHPLAELTRFALRTVAFHWQHEDWFGVLKSGLLEADSAEIDLLENSALAAGWEGNDWLQPLTASDSDLVRRLESLRTRLLPPFLTLRDAIAAGVSGQGLAAALRRLWDDIGAADTLGAWSETLPSSAGIAPAAHRTVWDQMNEWAEHLALAFGNETLSLPEWLPILEAGLSGLTVGVIPPSLDQVLVGTIDRSRNPDLKLAIVLGLNESVFPAPPPRPVLLTEFEREQLAMADAALSAGLRHRLGHERYYGYIACTRARERLVLTWAKADAAGEALQPSSFIRHLQQIVPGLTVEDAVLEIAPPDVRHSSELLARVLQNDAALAPDETWSALAVLPRFAAPLAKWCDTRREPSPLLGSETVQKLYPPRLEISVSALEEFAACPFKFFVARGLKAKERLEFEPDARERGTFQHELLARFHQAVTASGRRWRDLSPNEARELIQHLGKALVPEYRNGMFALNAATRFTADVLIENVQALAATLVNWARHYAFDPAAVELSFGLDAAVPAWVLDLGHGQCLVLRGRIDRIDLWRGEDGRARAVVMDYKSRSRQLDAVKLEHGLELQLLSYLGVLRNVPELGGHFGVEALEPAGVFYINLAARRASARSRHEEDGSPYQHLGRFDGEALDGFDTRPEPRPEQFKFARKKNGDFSKRGNEALPHAKFLDLVQLVEEKLREHGRRIFEGVVAIDPYRKGQEKACDKCDYVSLCRFDPWQQNYRVLRKQRVTAEGDEET